MSNGKRLRKFNINLPVQMREDLDQVENLTGRCYSELIRDYINKGTKDDLEFHLLKNAQRMQINPEVPG